MRKRNVIVSGLLGAIGAAVVTAVQVARAVPLVVELMANDGGTSKKDDKKDMMKKGSGPRTQRKKEKKGKG
jgi:dihydrodipicolinate reductase